MENFFLTILNMSLKTCWVILAVLLIRLLLKKAPKRYAYALWSVVGFRLICPVSFQSFFSLFRLFQQETSAVPQNIGNIAQPIIRTGIPTATEIVRNALPAATPVHGANPTQIWLFFGQLLWLIGIAILLFYSILSYFFLHQKLRTAVRLANTNNIYQSEHVRSPFILGLVHPRIYIPYHLDSDTQRYVLTHEHFHLRHLDHWIKPFAFCLLTLHWFNPLVWLAFHLMSKDMELRCDEAVLAGEPTIRKAYSSALLSFAANRRFPAPSPLAFSESGVKTRIKNALSWKQPKLWVTVLAAVLCVTVIAACAADPQNQTEQDFVNSDPLPNTEAEHYDSSLQSDINEFTCQISVGSITEPMRYFEDGFDSDNDSLGGATPEISDTYTITFLPSWECDTLTVGEDYYTSPSTGHVEIRQNTYELSRNEAGTFTLDVNPCNPYYGEKAIYYVPCENGGKFIEWVNFQAVDPWGLYLSAYECTTTSMTLHFAQKDGDATGTLQTGERFWIERQENGQWVSVNAQADRQAVWQELAYATEDLSLLINWEYLYGQLPAGTYRIGKEVLDYRAPGDYDTQNYYAVFVISEKTPIYVDPLDAAISQAILAHGKSAQTGGNFACESHVLLAHMVACGRAADEDDPKAWVGSDTVYLMALYQEYTCTGNGLEKQSGSHMPIVLSFDSYADGTRTLTEYWTPQDGEGYADSIREKFPADAQADALDTQKYILPQIQNCYSQAVAHYQLDIAPVLAGLFETLAASQATFSAPGEYLEAHPLEVRELMYYGDGTLQYIFREFLDGNLTDLTGQLMYLVMEQLLGDEAIDADAATAQECFDQWKTHVDALFAENGTVWMQKNAPKGWLLLQMLD